MRPEYHKNWVGFSMFDTLMNEVAWVNRDAPRDECFMALENLEYSYGNEMHARTYNSVNMRPEVNFLMLSLNAEFGTNYNVCFLNHYKSEREHLGWHSDDSPEMDQYHPIAVISFGAERFIWVKPIGFKGEIPVEDKYLLHDGSLFIMPPGFQEKFQHRIPKHDRPCGGRISLTFRRFVS